MSRASKTNRQHKQAYRYRLQIARDDLHAAFAISAFARSFNPMARMADGGGPTKTTPDAGFGELTFLRQKAVTGVDRLGAARACGFKNRRDVQIKTRAGSQDRCAPSGRRVQRARHGHRRPVDRNVVMPMRLAVRMMRQAISPRLAIIRVRNMRRAVVPCAWLVLLEMLSQAEDKHGLDQTNLL